MPAARPRVAVRSAHARARGEERSDGRVRAFTCVCRGIGRRGLVSGGRGSSCSGSSWRWPACRSSRCHLPRRPVVALGTRISCTWRRRVRACVLLRAACAVALCGPAASRLGRSTDGAILPESCLSFELKIRSRGKNFWCQILIFDCEFGHGGECTGALAGGKEGETAGLGNQLLDPADVVCGGREQAHAVAGAPLRHGVGQVGPVAARRRGPRTRLQLVSARALHTEATNPGRGWGRRARVLKKNPPGRAGPARAHTEKVNPGARAR